MRAAAVIPAYNEGASVGAVVRSIAGLDEVIVVDDGSTDDTADQAEAAGAVVIRHDRNRGYDAALTSGLSCALRRGNSLVLTLDADGQHDPHLVAAMLAPLRAGSADLVIGIRDRKARVSERIWGVYANRRFGLPDVLCGMKAYSAGLWATPADGVESHSIGTSLALAALRAGTRFDTVDVVVGERAHGRPRFGSTLRANWRILHAMATEVLKDVRA